MIRHIVLTKFKPDTSEALINEIYQGLAKIDSELGGTMPFDVILDADPAFYEAPVVTATADEGGGSDDEFGDQAADFNFKIILVGNS